MHFIRSIVKKVTFFFLHFTFASFTFILTHLYTFEHSETEQNSLTWMWSLLIDVYILDQGAHDYYTASLIS